MGKRKIVIIEDNKKLLANLKTFLEGMGYDVNTAFDGKTGLQLIRELLPDLIICDIGIPIIDGYKVLEELSQNKISKKIPFIFLTARVDKGDFRKGMQLGADDYIFKPFDLDDLHTSIVHRLDKSSQLTEKKENEGPYGIEDKVLLRFGKKMEFCDVKEIKYIKTEHPYTLIKLSRGKNTWIRKSLTEWETLLPATHFIRIHQSSIVNKEFVNKIEKVSKSTYILRIKDEEDPFIVSRRFCNRIKAFLL